MMLRRRRNDDVSTRWTSWGTRGEVFALWCEVLPSKYFQELSYTIVVLRLIDKPEWIEFSLSLITAFYSHRGHKLLMKSLICVDKSFTRLLSLHLSTTAARSTSNDNCGCAFLSHRSLKQGIDSQPARIDIISSDKEHNRTNVLWFLLRLEICHLWCRHEQRFEGSGLLSVFQPTLACET